MTNGRPRIFRWREWAVTRSLRSSGRCSRRNRSRGAAPVTRVGGDPTATGHRCCFVAGLRPRGLGVRREVARARRRAWLPGVLDEPAWTRRQRRRPARPRCARTPTTWSRWRRGSPVRPSSSDTGWAVSPWRTRWPATRPGPACWSRRCSAAWAPFGAALRAQPGRHRCRRSSAAGCGCAGASSSAGSCRSPQAREYARRVGGGNRPRWRSGSCCAGRPRSRRSATPPVLVVGSPDDRIVPRRSLETAARRYGGAPLLFPGMGHDLMLDARWQEPIDAILDWLDKSRLTVRSRSVSPRARGASLRAPQSRAIATLGI